MDKSLEELVEDVKYFRTDGWELLNSTKRMKFYKQQRKDTGLYQFLTTFVIDDVTPGQFASFASDVAHRKKWDPFIKELDMLDVDNAIFYWEVKYPWPMWNRDYICQCEATILEIDGEEGFLIITRSADYSFPDKPGIIRCQKLIQICAIIPEGSNSTRVNILMSDDPGTVFPGWFIRWAAQIAIVRAFDTMTTACLQYVIDKQPTTWDGTFKYENHCGSILTKNN